MFRDWGHVSVFFYRFPGNFSKKQYVETSNLSTPKEIKSHLLRDKS